MKKLFLARALAVLSVSAGSGELVPPAWSGPDATTKYLIDDRVSMLDFGMLRLEIEVEKSLAESDWFGYVRVLYDWKNDEILIDKFVYDFTLSKADAEELCSKWILRAKLEAGVIEGQLFTNISNSYFADYFGHFGFNRSDKPDTILSEIDAKFRLKCWVQFSTGHKNGLVSITATSPLIAKGYSIQKQP